MDFLSFFFVNHENIIDFFIIKIDLIDASNSQQEYVQIYLSNSELLKILVGLLY